MARSLASWRHIASTRSRHCHLLSLNLKRWRSVYSSTCLNSASGVGANSSTSWNVHCAGNGLPSSSPGASSTSSPVASSFRPVRGVGDGLVRIGITDYAQDALGVTPTYSLLDEKGPDHAKAFEVSVQIGANHYESSWGASKKQAEQQAALNALIALGVAVFNDAGEIVIADATSAD